MKTDRSNTKAQKLAMVLAMLEDPLRHEVGWGLSLSQYGTDGQTTLHQQDTLAMHLNGSKSYTSVARSNTTLLRAL